MKKSLILFSAISAFLFLSACSSIKDTAGQVKSWAGDSLEEIIEQANDGISIPALGGFGAGAMIEARLNELNNDNTEEIEVARMEEILEAIENQDSDAIYNMFSPNAKSDMKNFQEGTEYLFSLIAEEIESWDRTSGSQDITTHYGINTREYRGRFCVNTNNHQYIFIIRECLVDDTDTNNIGLYSIIAREKDKADTDGPTYFTDPGIYVPDQGSDDNLQ